MNKERWSRVPRWVRALLIIVPTFLLLSNWILRFELEMASHTFGGATSNHVMTHPCGYEAVYDESGALVEDPANAGSYNYFNAWEAPFRHQLVDRAPWILLGNSRDDPTTMGQRLGAWLRDVALAARAAFVALPYGHFAPQYPSRESVDCSSSTESGAEEGVTPPPHG